MSEKERNNISFLISYIERLKEALDSAISYQDWDDMNGNARYVNSRSAIDLETFEEENEDKLKKLIDL